MLMQQYWIDKKDPTADCVERMTDGEELKREKKRIDETNWLNLSKLTCSSSRLVEYSL